MLTEKLESALNKQINDEFFSAYLYLSMSSFFETMNLKGFGNWTFVQYQEEMTHALKIYNYVIERGGRVILEKIEQPESEWKDPLEVMNAVYEHEQKVTGLINNLVNISIEEKDHATNNFLQWFVAEQVEEESNVDEIVSELKFIGDNKQAIMMLDRELRQRVFVDETQQTNN
jgi:ferritin